MAHYDCWNCGASMGISYGYCSSCTPREVLKLAAEYKGAINAARKEFDNKVDHLKTEWVAKKTADIKARYELAYEAGKRANG